MKLKKQFFSKHTKSSAVVVTLALHGVFIVAGLSLVVMHTVGNEDPGFVHRVPVRKPIPLRNLQPPATSRQPKASRPNMARIEVNVKLDRKVPEIKLPDMRGLKAEIGGAVGGSVSALSTIAFAMPEVSIFDVRGKGEKIFLILDAGEHMLVDDMGGIPAYTIIKQEMIRIINELPPTAVFNVCVFGRGKTQVLFPQLVAANLVHAQQAADWLAPLNSADESVRSGRYGIQTLGRGGLSQKDDLRAGAFADVSSHSEDVYGQEGWFVAAMSAMQQQADTVFLLTSSWGRHRRVSGKRSAEQKNWMQSSAGKRWQEHADKAKEKLAEENRRRKSAGEPPKVIAGGRWGLISTYYPDVARPPSPEFYYFTPRNFQKAFELSRGAARPKQSGLTRGKHNFSFNVVQFVPGDSKSEMDARFKKLTRLSRGGYRMIAGMEAIRSYLESE